MTQQQRVRVRKLAQIKPAERPSTKNRYWAWSRPCVAEEIGRMGDNLRHYGPEGLVKEIHFHALDHVCPMVECLLVDAVPATMKPGPDEIEVA